MVIDVRKAHLNGRVPAGENRYVELPEELGMPSRVGKLRRWLYGMRPAASAWEAEYSAKLVSIGFKKGAASPTLFHRSDGTAIAVWGDDFVILGYHRALLELKAAVENWFEITFGGIMGHDAADTKEVTLLGRTVMWKAEALDIEADPRFARTLAERAGPDENPKGVYSPAPPRQREDGEPASADDQTRCKSGVAVLCYLSQDRLDVQYSSKEACRTASAPTTDSVARIKRASRYLLRYPRLV